MERMLGFSFTFLGSEETESEDMGESLLVSAIFWSLACTSPEVGFICFGICLTANFFVNDFVSESAGALGNCG